MTRRLAALPLSLLLVLALPGASARAQTGISNQPCIARTPGDATPDDGSGRLCPESDDTVTNNQSSSPLQPAHPEFLGCDDSPENSTLVLATLAAAALGTSHLRRRRRQAA